MREAQQIIAKKRFIQNGIILTKPNQIVVGEVEVYLFEPAQKRLKPIFEHEDFAIFDKPSQIYSMPQNRTTEYSMVDEARSHYGKNANIVHRLDYETSGLMIVSKNKKSERTFKIMLQDKRITKKYQAIIKGHLNKEFTVELPLIKNSDFNTSKHKVKVAPFGKVASTHITPIRYIEADDTTEVELVALSGRMHQLRVHLFYLFHPIIGDPLYGTSYKFADKYLNKTLSQEERVNTIKSKRLMLHANFLEFTYQNRDYKILSQHNLF